MLCALVSLQTDSVVGYPVGKKVGTDVFWAYLGFATAYAHAVLTGTSKQFGQLAGPIWLVFLLLGWYPMFLAHRGTAVTFFAQSLVSMLVATYLGYFDLAMNKCSRFYSNGPRGPSAVATA